MAERLLVVDDDEDTLKLVVLMLGRQGYDVLSANRGGQVQEIAKRAKPDLILLDVMMPDVDGFEVARRLRANHDTEHPNRFHLPLFYFFTFATNRH